MIYKFDDIATNSTKKKLPTDSDRDHYIGLEHIDPENFTISRWGSDVTPTGEKLLMSKGDILFGKRRAYQRKVAIAPFDGIFSAHGMVLRPKTDVINADFFPFFIASDQFMETAVRISVGGLSPTINWKDLKMQEFDLPSLEEQKILADKLWAAYRLKEAYKRLLVATDEMVKSQFIEMFEGTNWTTKTLSEIVDPKCPITYGIVQPGEDVDNGVPIVRPVDMTESAYIDKTGLKKTTEKISNQYKRTLLRGDEILVCVRGTTGLISKADGLQNCNVTRGIVPLYFRKEYNREFLYRVFLSDRVQSYINENTIGSTLKGINMIKLRELPIIIPPDNLQEEFVLIAKQADKSKYYVQNKLQDICHILTNQIQ